MKFPFIPLLVALPLCATPLATQAAGGEARAWPTLERVQADAPTGRVVEVSCKSPAWPTQHQVARDAALAVADEAQALRRHIVASGRAACARGSTHVLVGYRSNADGANPGARKPRQG